MCAPEIPAMDPMAPLNPQARDIMAPTWIPIKDADCRSWQQALSAVPQRVYRKKRPKPDTEVAAMIIIHRVAESRGRPGTFNGMPLKRSGKGTTWGPQ